MVRVSGKSIQSPKCHGQKPQAAGGLREVRLRRRPLPALDLETAAPGHSKAGTEVRPGGTSIAAPAAQRRLGPARSRFHRLGARTCPRTSPCLALRRLGAAGEQPRLGVRRDGRQLTKFAEGEKRSRRAGRMLLPLRSSRSASPRD